MKSTTKSGRSWGAVLATLAIGGALIIAPSEVSATGVTQAVLSLSVDGTLLRDGSTVNESRTVTVGVSSLLKEGTADRKLELALDPGFIYQTGGATAPEGWTLEYSTNGTTWVTTEPTPASGVRHLRAVKSNLAAGGLQGGSQVFSSETVTPIPASTFGASTGGDGWDTFFYDNYVLNIFHHSNYVALDCHLRTTGARCSGYDPTATTGAAHSKFSNYYAADRSGGWASGASGKVYAFTGQVNAPQKPGVLCINVAVAPPTNCGFTALSDDALSGYSDLSNAEGIGGRLFGLDAKNLKLLCFNPTTNAPCTNSPITVNGTAQRPEFYHVYPLGTKVFASTDTHLYCFDSSSLASCPGSWPVSYSSLGTGWTTAAATPPVAHMNASGMIDGVCMWNGCLDLSGVKQTWVNPHSITPWANSDPGHGYYGRYEATAGRAFLQEVLSNHTIYCFDYATNAACANFDTTPNPTDSSLYALKVDPNNPNCVWYNSDPGRIGLFDAISGAPECSGNPVITLQPSSFAPRYSCSSTLGVDEWRQLRLTSIAGTGTPASIALTVRNSLGETVAGWSNRAITVGQALDMTGLDVGSSGSRPTFNFAFSGVTGGSITSATVSLDYVGKGPELCARTVLSAGGSACPVLAGLTGTVTDNVGGADTSTVVRSLTVGTNPTACAESLREMTVPGPVRNFSTSGPEVSFDPPEDDGGTPVTGYRYSLDNGQSWLVATTSSVGGSRLKFTLPAQSTSGTYTVEVRAVNAIGRSSGVRADGSYAAPVVTPTPAAPVAEPTPQVLPTTGNGEGSDQVGVAMVILAIGLVVLRRSSRLHY